MTGRRKYESAITGAPVRVRRRIPTRAPTVQADFVVPALSGLLLGALAAIVPALLLAALLGAFWAAWLGFASVFCTVAILWRLGVIDRSLWATEEIETTATAPEVPAGLEMPALPAPQTPVLLNPYQGRATRDAERREETQSDFARFVEGCADDTTLRRWEPEIGRRQYQEWRDLLISAGWADWKNPANQRDGWSLSAPAATIIEALDA